MFAVCVLIIPFQPIVCLEYILKVEMHNFVKGKAHSARLEPILGRGIFTSDGEDWLWQHKLAADIFSMQG